MMQVNAMGEGSSFGELALLNNAPRMATIITQTPCIFAVLNKVDYKNVISKIQKQKIENEIAKLKKVAGFDSLSRRGMNMLMYSFKTQHYQMRDNVYKEGDANDQNFYIIKSGQFRIIKNIALYNELHNGIDDQISLQMMKLISLHQIKQNQILQANKKVDICLLSDSEIFGDQEVFSKSELRLNTVQCYSQTGEVYVIEYKVLKKRMKVSNESFLVDLLKNMSQRKE